MKEKFAFILMISILSLFVGYLFLHGQNVIHGKDANNFISFAFVNDKNSISLQPQEFSALNADFFGNASGVKNVEVRYLIDDMAIDTVELAITPKSSLVNPTQTVLDTIKDLDGKSFEYKLEFSWQKDRKDFIKKKLTIE